MLRCLSVLRLAALLPLIAAMPAGAQEAPPAPDTSLPELLELEIVRSNIAEAPRTVTVEAAEAPEFPTRITDPAAALGLFHNEGVTLQWIGWEKRGGVWIAIDREGRWLFTAEQKGGDTGRLELEGFITEIGTDYFVFDGTIKILGAPDTNRLCNTTKTWRFAVTQNRSYYRLREFEWCDGLTDYIDVYFTPKAKR